MADAKPAAQKTTDAKPASAKLAKASESSDPAVHELLARKQTASMNADNDEVKRISAELADLGYE